MAKELGECPHCGGNVLMGKYGAYCTRKCGMNLNYALGQRLTEEQIKDLLGWRQTYVKNMKRRDGSTFSAYIRPAIVVPYSYVNKNGETKTGYQYRFSFEFVS